jgi:Domain of unknown function (DUF4359)
LKKLLIIIGVIILLAITNPKNQDFIDWAEQKAIAASEDPIIKTLNYLLADNLINVVTTREDFILFSTYSIQLGDSEIKFIGILNNFLPFNDELQNLIGSVFLIIFMIIIVWTPLSYFRYRITNKNKVVTKKTPL